MPFLRDDFEMKETSSNYMRFQDGENKIRILTPAIDGWEYWLDSDGNIVPRGELGGKESQPVRVKTLEEATNKNPGAQYESKQFIAFIVWNYKEKRMQILEITQKTIIKALEGLDKSNDWGDVTQYDIVIERSGKKLNTEYTIRPTPKKAFEEDIKNLDKINLDALYAGEDPFGNIEAVEPEDILGDVVEEVK